ncbi:membrane cofactor protein-like [Rhynchonycteris naso]
MARDDCILKSKQIIPDQLAQWKRILCKPPEEIPNGMYTNSGKDTYEYNEVVTYSCNPSNGPDEYSLVGESTLICSGQNKWSSDPPECKVVKCPYPVVNNGIIVSEIETEFNYKAKVTFECLQGYLLEGSSTVECGASSTWEPGLPNCTEARLWNSAAVRQFDHETAGLHNSSTAGQQDGRTAGLLEGPQCNPGNSDPSASAPAGKRKPAIGPPVPSVTAHTARTSGTSLDTLLAPGLLHLPSATIKKVNAQCPSGFSLMSGKMAVTYKPRWAPSYHLDSPFSSWRFLGIPSVALVLLLPLGSDACDDPPRFHSMMFKGPPQTVYQPGDRAEYECRLGYMPIVPPLSTTAVCQADDTWTPLLEACKRKQCQQLGDPVNGQVVYVNGNFEFGSEAHYECNEGYHLLGTSILYCELSGSNVEWSDNPPQCERILCKPPGEIPNGMYTNSGKDTYEYNEVVTYSCNPTNGPDEYSLVGKSTLICSGQDQWSSDPPECKVIKCPYPVLKNGRPTSAIGSKFSYEAKVTFECLQGFLLEGRSTVVCGANSTWEPEMPICIKGYLHDPG